ncbi:MAG: hypothetical protein JNM76_02595 [Betaproteobacteria bacterium]|nr:hypothetical protein [Betaproteobacteria bacterium]
MNIQHQAVAAALLLFGAVAAEAQTTPPPSVPAKPLPPAAAAGTAQPKAPVLAPPGIVKPASQMKFKGIQIPDRHRPLGDTIRLLLAMEQEGTCTLQLKAEGAGTSSQMTYTGKWDSYMGPPWPIETISIGPGHTLYPKTVGVMTLTVTAQWPCVGTDSVAYTFVQAPEDKIGKPPKTGN